MMPPSESEDEADGEDKPSTSKAAPRGQNPNAGLMPPSDSSSSDEDGSSSDDGDSALPEYLTAPSTKKK
jgi:hypothetical protein